MRPLYRVEVLTYIIFFSVIIKLVISPWSIGVLESQVGSLLNNTVDITFLVVILIGYFSINKKYEYIYICAIVSGLSYFLSTILFTSEASYSFLMNHLKVYLPLLALPILYQYFELKPQRYLKMMEWFSWIILILVLLGFILLPTSFNRFEAWWPTYFGGLHTSAYVVLIFSAFIFVLYESFEMKSTSIYCLLFIFIFISISYGWGVRTATIAFIIFTFGILLRGIQDRDKWVRFTGLVILFSIICIVFVANYNQHFTVVLDTLSSGRISMYNEKLSQLADNSVFEWFIGGGYNSDLIISEVWWWEAKGAHSDIITMLVEGGLFYLSVFIYIFCMLWKTSTWIGKSLLLSVLFTTFFSNGVFVRPTVGYLFAFALVAVNKLDRIKTND